MTYDTTGYTLAWSDEFDGTAVDTSKWTVLDVADNTNGNAEYYSPDNITVSGGYLNITAKKENVGGRAYTSGAMGSYGKYTFQYGKVVGCIKMPTPAPGYWPAFWMIGDYTSSWPSCGEIDIMENIGTSMVVGTCHWGTNNTTDGSSTTTTVDAFHAYGMIWDAQHISFLVDDVEYFTMDITSADLAALRSRYYFWINMAIGGPTSWPGAPTTATPFPAVMQVDYVRVYQ